MNEHSGSDFHVDQSQLWPFILHKIRVKLQFMKFACKTHLCTGFHGTMPYINSGHVFWLLLCSPIEPDELVVRCVSLPHVLPPFSRFRDLFTYLQKKLAINWSVRLAFFLNLCRTLIEISLPFLRILFLLNYIMLSSFCYLTDLQFQHERLWHIERLPNVKRDIHTWQCKKLLCPNRFSFRKWMATPKCIKCAIETMNAIISSIWKQFNRILKFWPKLIAQIEISVHFAFVSNNYYYSNFNAHYQCVIPKCHSVFAIT